MPFAHGLPLPSAYFLVGAKGAFDKAYCRDFHRWMVAEAGFLPGVLYYLTTLDHAIEQGTGVRAVNGDQLASTGFDIRQKTLVALDQAPFFKLR